MSSDEEAMVVHHQQELANWIQQALDDLGATYTCGMLDLAKHSLHRAAAEAAIEGGQIVEPDDMGAMQ